MSAKQRQTKCVTDLDASEVRSKEIAISTSKTIINNISVIRPTQEKDLAGPQLPFRGSSLGDDGKAKRNGIFVTEIAIDVRANDGEKEYTKFWEGTIN